MAKDKKLSKFERAKKRVGQLRRLYRHITIYLVVNSALLLLQGRVTVILISKEALGNPGFLGSIFWDTYGTSIIWGFFLGIHALKVFASRPLFGPKWEERQIRKYMGEEAPKQ